VALRTSGVVVSVRIVAVAVLLLVSVVVEVVGSGSVAGGELGDELVVAKGKCVITWLSTFHHQLVASRHAPAPHHLNNNGNKEEEHDGDDTHRERIPGRPQNRAGPRPTFSTNGLEQRN
jgi:hypothetical protein